MSKTVLFIGHDATRTGAPIMFLHFIDWVKAHTDTNVIILLKKGGPLVEEFEKTGPTFIYFGRRSSSVFSRFIDSYRSRMNTRKIRRVLKRSSVDLIYSNTITNGYLYHVLKDISAPIVTHVHELERVIKNFAANNLEYIKAHTTHYVAASGAVKDNLMSNHDIDGGKISVVHEFIQTAKFSQDNGIDKQGVLSELGIESANPFIVGGAGGFVLRKGADIFIHVLKKLVDYDLSREVIFLWVGAEPGKDLYNWLLDDVRKAGLHKNLKIIPPTADPARYYSIMHVFLMTSREDPYPLVCLETAAMGKPIICFKDGGGMPEFVEGDSGAVVPYLDVDQMADSVKKMLEDPELLRKLSSNAATKVRERHDVNTVAPILFKKIEEIIACH